MLNKVYTGLLLLLFSSAMFLSCEKDDDNPGGNPADYTGNWRVSLYYDNATDETYYFNGYTILFGSNNVLTVTNGNINVVGEWFLSGSRLYINFGTTPLFEDWNNDWLIAEKTETTLKLKDDNPLQDDRLEFIRQ